MKILLLFTLFGLGIGKVNAQYTNLFNFNGSNGAAPIGSLIISGEAMYGMTLDGGLHDSGCVFSIDTGGHNFRDLLDFNGKNGAFPEGSLALSENKLYGMTQIGGACYKGSIFLIDTNGNGYKDLFDFCGGTSGLNPSGKLTISGKSMYGMTVYGGINGKGNIFSIDTNGNNYVDLLDFNGTNGAYPYGSLTLSGSKLFGMTHDGGVMNEGCVFSVDTKGNGYRDLLDFNVTNGGLPFGSLILSGSTLYGMTTWNFNFGNIFSLDTNGSGYKDLFDFNGINGNNPQGDLTLSGSNLYGMTMQGGTSDSGIIFSIDSNGSGEKVLLSFKNAFYPEGAFPVGSLTLFGNKLFGMAKRGGIYGYGVVFSYRDTSIHTLANELTTASEIINVCPNPNNGIFTIVFHNINERALVEIYNIFGEEIYKAKLNSENTLVNLVKQQNGVCFYRILKEDGEVVGSGKLIIE